MKISLQNRSLSWHAFLDFTLFPDSLRSPFKKKLLIQKKTAKKLLFIHHYLEESKVKNLYKRLHGLYRVSTATLKKQQELGKVKQNLHPLEEQNWFITYLKSEVAFFSPEEIWTILLNVEERDKYSHYLEGDEDWQPFEIFLQNYWIHALDASLLVAVFVMAFQDEIERSGLLTRLFKCLECSQAYELLKAVKMDKPHPKDWEFYCRQSILCMRNSQVKKSLRLLPRFLVEVALRKLYPCEVLEVIEEEKDEHKKNYLIEKSLQNYKIWWEDFCYEEVKHTVNVLKCLIEE